MLLSLLSFVHEVVTLRKDDVIVIEDNGINDDDDDGYDNEKS